MPEIIALVLYVGAAIYMIVEPDVVGGATGWVRGHYIDTPTPGCMVRFAGCAMLAVLPGGAVGVTAGTWLGVVAGLAVAVGLYMLAERFLPR
ncbi:MAG: hypothetical protein ACP5KN_11030 [Armatimonadota bacterium]